MLLSHVPGEDYCTVSFTFLGVCVYVVGWGEGGQKDSVSIKPGFHPQDWATLVDLLMSLATK